MATTKGTGSFFSSLLFWLFFAAFFVAAVWLFFYLRTTFFTPAEEKTDIPVVMAPSTQVSPSPTPKPTPTPTATPTATPTSTPATHSSNLPTTGPSADEAALLLTGSGSALVGVRYLLLKKRLARTSRTIDVLR